MGWVITRGANLQKYTFKRSPERPFLGFVRPVTVTDGEREILCSGFWGAARHMNYTGEILEALGMSLALGHFTNVWAWIYFVYLTIFFVIRERIDDGRCAGKYGALWPQYRGKVPLSAGPRGLLSAPRRSSTGQRRPTLMHGVDERAVVASAYCYLARDEFVADFSQRQDSPEIANSG